MQPLGFGKLSPLWVAKRYKIVSVGKSETLTNMHGRQLMLPGIKLFDMTGKSAIITGGSKGLGEAMAAGLASAGADVLLTSRNAEEVEATAAKIAEEYGHKAIGIAADVTEPDQVAAMTQRAMEEFGKIDVVINNAGINIRGPIDELKYEEFQQVQKVNVDGIWLVSRSVIPHMKEAKYGRIINMASTLGVVGLSNRTPYATSKGAVVQMTRALGLELAPFGITCNAICPGPFLTPMNIPIAEDEQTKKFIVGAVALERWGNMEEIQGAAIFLASDASSYMIGSLVTVDGGWTAR
jgi:NAD(P)-dependent dehydrogenase (short-subunit alcohol dehydrogenase family)